MSAAAYAFFLPWIVYMIFDRTAGQGAVWAATAGTICALALILLAVSQKKYDRLLGIVLVVLVFASILLVHNLLAMPANGTFDSFSRSIATAGMAVVLVTSLFVRPVSHDFLSSVAPPTAQNSLRLRQLDRQITGRWALTMAVLSVIMGIAALWPGAFIRTICDWMVPLIACIATIHRDRWSWQVRGQWMAYISDGEESIAIDIPRWSPPPDPKSRLASIHELHSRDGSDRDPA